jgi:hypothetical protein
MTNHRVSRLLRDAARYAAEVATYASWQPLPGRVVCWGSACLGEFEATCGARAFETDVGNCQCYERWLAGLDPQAPVYQ